MLLYIHVPFCARRCSYCDFAIAVRRAIPSDAFVEAITTEWCNAIGGWEEDRTLQTIYFGGGTPSILSADAVARLIDSFGSVREISERAEITMEVNPDDVDLEKARAWRAAGINRLSLGVQSFDPRVLGWMHRTHDALDPRRAMDVVRDVGFENVSLDLIYGLPTLLQRDWPADLGRALELRPAHLSLYGLTIESGTPLGRWVDRAEIAPAADIRMAEEYLYAHTELTVNGFRHYEVSNAALPGFESRHNGGYWKREAYLGLGPSAHSARGARRWWNEREWEAYRRAIGDRGEARTGDESLNEDQVRIEDIYLGLRTDRGIPASTLPVTLVTEWVAADWASLNGSRLVLKPEGWLRLDALVAHAVRS